MSNQYSDNQILKICLDRLYLGHGYDSNTNHGCPFCLISNGICQVKMSSTRIKSHLTQHTKEEFVAYFGVDFGERFYDLCIEFADEEKTKTKERNTKRVYLNDDSKKVVVDFDLVMRYLALFFISCDIPESHVTNQFLNLALKAINPSVPNISLNSFHKAFDQVLKVTNVCVSERIETSSNLYISFDGTKTLKGEQIQNVSVITDNNRFLYKLYSFAKKPENAVNLAEMQDQVISSISPSKVRGIICDNCPANIASRDHLQNSKPSLIFQGCAAHEADLLLKDIFKVDTIKGDNKDIYTPANMKAKIEQCTVYFRKAAVRKLYSEINEEDLDHLTLPKLPNDTRWYSLEPSTTWLCTNYSECQEFFKSIPNNSAVPGLKEETDEIAAYFSSYMFRSSLEDLDKILKSGRKFIESLEKSDCDLSCVYGLYQTFVNEIRTNIYYDSILALILKRGSFFMSDLLFFAYSLDPRHEISELCYQRSTDYIVKHYFEDCDALLDSYSDYYHNREYYCKIKKDKMMHCKTAYDIWDRCLTGKIKTIALQILNCPPSIAYNESIWSFFKLINRSRRSRLSVNKIEKLLYIRVNIQSIMKKEDYNLFNMLLEDKDKSFFGKHVGTLDNNRVTNKDSYQTYDDGLDHICDDKIDSADFLYSDVLIGDL